jgi:hypothetical protein
MEKALIGICGSGLSILRASLIEVGSIGLGIGMTVFLCRSGLAGFGIDQRLQPFDQFRHCDVT